MSNPTYVVKYEYFSGSGPLDALFTKAAEFAASIGPDRVINISHSAHLTEGVVTVWYRAEADRVEG